jgi:hypothetical protein
MPKKTYLTASTLPDGKYTWEMDQSWLTSNNWLLLVFPGWFSQLLCFSWALSLFWATNVQKYISGCIYLF